MRLIKPSFEIFPQQIGVVGMFKHIEACGRVAWKSEGRTTDDSYVGFLEMLKGVNHGSVLEHGTIYLKVKWYSIFVLLFFLLNKHSKIRHWSHITTNYRVIVDNNKAKYMQYMTNLNKPSKYHERRFTVRFICDRGVSHEYVRHRVFSFTQESTRFCNYSQEKFGNEITFITPIWLGSLSSGSYNVLEDNGVVDTPDGVIPFQQLSKDKLIYLAALQEAEGRYFALMNLDWKPQQARSVLPNSLKTELIMTGFTSDWKHFFKLRCAKAAHPQARELAIPLLLTLKSNTEDFNDIHSCDIIK